MPQGSTSTAPDPSPRSSSIPWQQLFACAAWAVAVGDPRTKTFQAVNEAYARMHGYTVEELTGRSIATVYSQGHWADLPGRAWSKGEYLFETEHARKDGSSFPVLVHKTVMSGPDGRDYTAVTVQDLTERNLGTAARAASQAKSEFLAHVSHEMRTPLTAILGFADLLKANGTPLDPNQGRFVETIDRNARQLARLIDTVLDITKIEMGHLAIEQVETPLRPLLADVVATLDAAIRRKSLEIKVTWSDDVPETAITDPSRLRQILLNILGNAVKFTNSGLIAVDVQGTGGSSPARAAVVFSVRDSGIGIEPRAVGRLFQPFSQVDQTVARRYGGSGLGLYFSRTLARALGGDVDLAASTPGQGSTFTVRISNSTVLERLAPHSPATLPQQLASTTVLVVDDVEDTRQYIKSILELSGAAVDLANDGQSGMTMALAKRYDVVIMDLEMPFLDGLEAVRRLRHTGYERAIIVLTAHATMAHREDALRSGCDTWLTKPIDREKLLAAVAEHSAFGQA